MIQAVARVLENVIELKVSDELWTCRPVVAATGGVTRRVAALFATTYETYRSSDPQAVHSTVTYHVKKDEILIQIGEQKWRTRSTILGPMYFDYGGVNYAINEKLTGRFAILDGSTVVAQGELGFRSCNVREVHPDLEMFLANVALGLLIRTLVWEMLR